MSQETKISIIIGSIMGVLPTLLFGLYIFDFLWWLIVISTISLSAYLRHKYDLDNTMKTKLINFKNKYFYDNK